jgi:hypothetical protein
MDTSPAATLKVLPAYTGATTLESALNDPRHHSTLWLEILFNDQIDVACLRKHPVGDAAYRTACRWYTTYRSLIQFISPRTPLPLDHGPIDERQYRTFIEALHFVSPDD